MNKKNLDFTQARQWDNEDVQFRDIDLSIARSGNKPLEIDMGGSQIYICQNAYNSKFKVDASSTVGSALLSLNEKGANPIEANKGFYVDTNGAFNKIYLRNEAQANKKMRIVVSTDTTLAPFAAEATVSINEPTSGSNGVVSVTNTATEILAADTNRKDVLISNQGSNDIYIGFSNSVTTVNGMLLKAGGSMGLDYAGSLYGITASGSSNTSYLSMGA